MWRASELFLYDERFLELGDVYISNCTILDATSEEVRDRQSVSVLNGEILAIDAAENMRRGPTQQLINGLGKFVIPSLWDVHTHPGTAGPRDLESNARARLDRVEQSLLTGRAAGVLGVRVLGEALLADIKARGEIADQCGSSITLKVAGPALKPTGGHGYVAPNLTTNHFPSLVDQWGSIEVDSLPALRRQVRKLVTEQRVDWIKVFVSGGIAGDHESHTDTHMTMEQIHAVCDQASHYGVPVAAHAGNPEAVARAVAAGVTSIEHGYEISRENAAQMASRGIWYVPTLSITHNVARMKTMGWSASTIAKARALQGLHKLSLTYAREAGVRVACGSDMRPLGPASVEEVLMLEQNGYSAWESLCIATQASAELCGESAVRGTVEVGKRADLCVLRGDPRENLRVLMEPEFVINGGQLVAGGRSSDD